MTQVLVMFHNGVDLVSLNDFVQTMCKPEIEKNESISHIGNDFCSLISSKFSYEGNKCFKAEASDKTRHLLFDVELVLEIFMTDNMNKNITTKTFINDLKKLLENKYIISVSTCCCCPKKLKKSLTHSISFTEFVRQGDVELRRFNSIKSSLKFIICLDIEAYENCTDKLLEFGFAIFDLHSKTTSNTHIIVSDYIYLKNGRFVADNRHKFNFGKSHYLSLKMALEHVLAVLDTPSSCLIGHNIKSDIRFLKSSSKNIFNLPVFDTQIIYKQATLCENFLGLVRVLDEIGIPHSNLHNAGNDSHYTLEVFRKLANL